MFKLFKDYILGIDKFIANDIQYNTRSNGHSFVFLLFHVFNFGLTNSKFVIQINQVIQIFIASCILRNIFRFTNIISFSSSVLFTSRIKDLF